MDEEAVGLFGVLLIVTILVLSHPLKPSQAMPTPTLAALHWQNVVDAFGCKDASAQDCASAIGQ